MCRAYTIKPIFHIETAEPIIAQRKIYDVFLDARRQK